MALLEPKSLARIADALEKLVALYELDLALRGLTYNPPDKGEGEVLATDDAEVSERINRTKNFTGIPRPGFYVGGDEIPELPGPRPGEEVNVNYPDSLFGSSWGLNVGPEGAEENRTSPDGDRSS